MLYTNSTVALSADTTARLTGLLRDMQAALPAINAQRFPAPGQLERQVRISSVTVDFVQAVLSDKVVSFKDAVSMARGLLPLIWENIKEAGAAQVQLYVTWVLAKPTACDDSTVDRLDKAFRELSAMLTPLQSDALRVVVSSSHMARPQNLISQVSGGGGGAGGVYWWRLPPPSRTLPFRSTSQGVSMWTFSKATSEWPCLICLCVQATVVCAPCVTSGASRFVTLETISSEQTALALMDTHVTDYATGTAFFGDAFRMHEGAASRLAVMVAYDACVSSLCWGLLRRRPVRRCKAGVG